MYKGLMNMNECIPSMLQRLILWKSIFNSTNSCLSTSIITKKAQTILILVETENFVGKSCDDNKNLVIYYLK